MAEASTPNVVFTVLLVEDNEAQACLIKKRLNQASNPSFTVHHAASLGEGLEMLSIRPDAMLLDLSLPDSQGLNTFLKMHEHASHVPIIILTALDNESIGVEAVRQGAQDYLIKGKTQFGEIPRLLRFAIERNKNQAELRQWSMTDELTGLHNRRGFNFLAEQELKNAFRGKRNLLFTYLDLNGLKSINDTYGHEAGDSAIKAMAQVLKDTFRSSDIIARMGGDEFAVISLDASPEGVDILSTRLEESSKRFKGHFRFDFSFSWGMSLYRSDAPGRLEDLLSEADRQMYRRKKNPEISEEEPAATLQIDRQKKLILIVEDDLAIRKLLEMRLAQAGFSVASAGDGQQGLAQARELRPDLVLLDLRLPKLPGEEVCKAIREDRDKEFARTPIIMLTAKSSDVDRVIGNVIGASRYMTKPFDGEVLVSEIKKLTRTPKKRLL